MSNSISLLEVKQKLYARDTKTNVIFHFTVDQPYERLKVEFSYSPKSLEDLAAAEQYITEAVQKYSPEEDADPSFNWRDYLPLNNLITVSADDNNGEYRGCGHRQSPDQVIYIGKDSASDGFYPGPIGIGSWRIVLSVHSIVQDCDIDLKVSGEILD